MKFTSEDLIKAMGLQVGDRIRINDGNIFKVISDDTIQSIESEYCTCLSYIIDHKYEILPRPKRVGDLKCEELGCMTCPLRILSHCGKSKGQEDNLYKILNYWNNEYPNFDQEIYDLLKKRLDKEVVEE